MGLTVTTASQFSLVIPGFGWVKISWVSSRSPLTNAAAVADPNTTPDVAGAALASSTSSASALGGVLSLI